MQLPATPDLAPVLALLAGPEGQQTQATPGALAGAQGGLSGRPQQAT